MTMIKEHPCPAGEYTWWVSRHEEGPYIDAKTTDKNAAIKEAIGQGEVDELPPHGQGEGWEYGVYLAWARSNHVRLDRYFDAHDWLDQIADQMDDEDGPDEDGDRHPIDDVSKDDKCALSESVRSAIWHWQNRRAILCKAYWLDMPYGPRWERVKADE